MPTLADNQHKLHDRNVNTFHTGTRWQLNLDPCHYQMHTNTNRHHITKQSSCYQHSPYKI